MVRSLVDLQTNTSLSSLVMKRNTNSVLLALGLAALLCACTPTVASRGNILDSDKIAEVKVGASTREEVATALGSPTTVSPFDDKVWYYIGRQTEQYSFFDPEVVQQKAVEVQFDDQGIVTAVNNLDLSGAQEVDPVGRATPTYGRNDTLIRQLIGNLAHPTVPGGRSSNPGGK